MYSTSNLDTAIDVYGDDVEVDYRGYEVTPENFIRLLTGRHDSSVPRSKRLLSDENSNVFLYMTGHGAYSYDYGRGAMETTMRDYLQHLTDHIKCISLSLSLCLSLSLSLS